MGNEGKPVPGFGISWHKAGGVTLSAMEENKPVEVAVGGKRVCVLRRGTVVYAFAATCPHAGVPLCEGWVDAMGRIVCPLHKYRFDPTNGRNTSGEGYKLFTYVVEIRGDDVYVGLIG